MAKAPQDKAVKTGPTKRELLAARDAKIVSDYKGGAEVPDLASKNTLSEVRIYRILAANTVSLRPKAKAAPKAKATKKASKKKVAKKSATKKPAAKGKPAPLGIPKSQSARKATK